MSILFTTVMSNDYIITNYNKHQSYLRMVADAKGQMKLTKKKKKRKPKVIRPKISGVKNPTRNYYLYALELEDSYYYVGMTAYKDAVKRFEQHCAGKGAQFTKLHVPVRIMEVRNIGHCKQTTAQEAENLMTREYMSKYGLYRVRGGDLCYKNETMVALHFNDAPGKKAIHHDRNGKRIKKTASHIRQAEKIQRQIAEELSWIV